MLLIIILVRTKKARFMPFRFQYFYFFRQMYGNIEKETV